MKEPKFRFPQWLSVPKSFDGYSVGFKDRLEKERIAYRSGWMDCRKAITRAKKKTGERE